MAAGNSNCIGDGGCSTGNRIRNPQFPSPCVRACEGRPIGLASESPSGTSGEMRRAWHASPKTLFQKSPCPTPIGRAPKGPQSLRNPAPQKLSRDHKVFGGVGKDLKTRPRQKCGCGRLDHTQPKQSGCNVFVFFADDFKLDRIGLSKTSRGHMGGGDASLNRLWQPAVLGNNSTIEARGHQLPEILTTPRSPPASRRRDIPLPPPQPACGQKASGQHFWATGVIARCPASDIGQRRFARRNCASHPACPWGRALSMLSA